jgi:uncharacterized protein
MSTIIVFGAAGTAGQRIVKEAATRGHRVVAAVRRPDAAPAQPAGVTLVQGDATNADDVARLAQGADAVVLAVGGPGRTLYRDAAETVSSSLAQLPEPRPRLLHMGGGATLTTPGGTRFADLPDFPAEYLDPALGQAAALDFYTASANAVDWLYLSPPPVEFAPGERTGRYRVGHDQPVADADGRSALSYEDFAVLVVDQVETPSYHRRRITAAY